MTGTEDPTSRFKRLGKVGMTQTFDLQPKRLGKVWVKFGFFVGNKLSINLKKTHFMIFRKRKVKIILKEKIVINNVNPRGPSKKPR